MAFGLNFFTLAPGLRVAGDSLAYAYKFTKKGGQGDGKEGLEIGLTDDPTIRLLEAAVSGYEEVTDRDTVYTALVSGGLIEIVPGFALGIDSLSSIEITASAIKLAVAGAQPLLQFRSNNVQVVTKVGDSGYTWDLPPATFATLKTAAENYQSDLKTKVDEMIAQRIAADDTLTAAVAAQGASDAAALAAEVGRVDNLIATGMWLFADQASFPAAADNHGRVVHSHADAAIFYAHGGMWHQVAKEVDLQATISSVASEAATRAAADTALSGRLDVLEADPTTATAVAAGDAATLSSANTYTDTAVSNVIGSAPGVLDTLGEIADAINDDANVYTTLVSQVNAVQTDVDANEVASDAADAALSGRLDTLEVDPTTAAAVQAVQDNLDTEAGTRAAADSALDGRLDVLEADPTTATAVAAVQSDVDANQTSSEAADTALSGRLDVLEADPTTGTAVAAVQADVDQNEADSDAADAALSGRLDVLEADPTTATALAAVQSDVDQNEADSDAADAALSSRLDVLEADPTTATAVAAVQSDVDQNEADADAAIAGEATTRGNADSALSGRLDVLEADPTTATAVAAVQADVDQNEADADTALALKAPLADPDFTGQLEVDTNARIEFADNLTKVHNVLRGTSIEVGNNIQLNPAAADGRVEIEGGLYLRPSDMVDAANDTQAAAAGVIVGGIYRNGSVLHIRVS